MSSDRGSDGEGDSRTALLAPLSSLDGVERARLADAVALVAAVVAGAVVLLLAREVFPYLSVNDDEGVYLLQAAMLLEGQLVLRPGELGTAVRPWFFIVRETGSGLQMYPKYTPPTAALLALSKALVGRFDAALGAIAAATAALTYALTVAGFDRRTGVVAVGLLAASPLFLLTSATHLSYAPATALNLLFGLAYVRAARVDAAGRPRRALAWATLAGFATGAAFFTRAYTAVLFAVPFITHALWSLWRARRRRVALVRTTGRLGAVAAVGLAWVAVALWYNAVLTGDPLLFPYEAFAPADGIGFGRREILGYDRTYTPALAAATTVEVLVEFVSEWTTAGPIGAGLAAIGGGYALSGRGPDRWATMVVGGDDSGSVADDDSGSVADDDSGSVADDDSGSVADDDSGSVADDATPPGCPPLHVRRLLAGVVVAVVVGEAYFWGTMNGLDNGLIELLGPFYHFDLLLPLSAFGAAALVGGWETGWRQLRRRLDRRTAGAVAAAAAVLVAAVAGPVAVAVVADPVGANADRSANLAAAYEPFEETTLDDAVVFTPDPYGDWQQHPFQHLRNDPGFDGDAVYVLDEGPERDWELLAATDDRDPYRYTYRGGWTAGAGEPIEPALVPLEVVAGDAVAADVAFGVPGRGGSATVRLETETDEARYRVDAVPENGSVEVEWALGPDGARVTNHEPTGDGERVAVPDGASEVDVVVTFVAPAGSTVSYRQEATVRVDAEGVAVVWPPETRICRLATECGPDGTWVGPDGDYLSGVSVESEATAVGGASGGNATETLGEAAAGGRPAESRPAARSPALPDRPGAVAPRLQRLTGVAGFDRT